MRSASMRWFLLGYLALLILAMAIHSGETIGIKATSVNSIYAYEAGAPPWSIAFSVVGLALLLMLGRCQVQVSSQPLPHLFRRWVAGIIDWFLAIVISATIQGLVTVLIEFRRTGILEWVVVRSEYRTGDLVIGFGSVFAIMFAIMPAYFVAFWKMGKPTPGACILGYRIVADDGLSLSIWFAYLRALLGGIALLGWPCWIIAYWVKRDRTRGKIWLDLIFHTHAEFLT